MNSFRKRTLYSEISDSVITVRNTTGEVTSVVEGARWREGGSLVEVIKLVSVMVVKPTGFTIVVNVSLPFCIIVRVLVSNCVSVLSEVSVRVTN